MNNTNVITELSNRQQIRAVTVKRIAGYANAVTALLETYDIVPPAGQPDIVAVASSIANDIARDLASLIGGEA